MKVLHVGTALYQPYELSRALRELGVEADCMVLQSGDAGWLIGPRDINLDIGRFTGPLARVRKMAAIIKFMLTKLGAYDIVHFHSYASFIPLPPALQRFWDLKILVWSGRKVFASWWGCDIRLHSDEVSQPWHCCTACTEINGDICNEAFKKRMLGAVKKHCSANFVAADLGVSHPDFVWMDNAIDTQKWKPMNIDDIPEEYRLARDGNILVYHSFANNEVRGDVKGTHYIVEAVQELQDEGYPVRLMFFNRVPNDKIKYYQAQADIVVDQLLCGFYGSTAIECMSLGKPVVCNLRSEIKALCPHKDIPVIEANVTNIKSVLKDLLDNPDRLASIGHVSREYVVKVHDRRVVAEKIYQYYLGKAV